MFVYNKDLSEDEILTYAKNLEGMRLKDIADSAELNKWLSKSANKGAIGNAIQACYFNIPANSIREADFNYHNLELKVTPIKQNKNKTLSSKERLSLTMIDYMNDYKLTFYESSVWHKCGEMLLVFYLYEENVSPENFIILKVEKFIIPSEDLPQIEEDYNKITNKIKLGEAHLLSESQTTYLAASTKGAGKGKDGRKQPFSTELANSRGYSFKPKYIAEYFNLIYHPNKIESLKLEEQQTLDGYINKTLGAFTNLSTEIIEKNLNYYPYKKIDQDKSYLPRLVSKMFGIDGTDLDKVQQFQKGNIKFKTIRIRQKNSDNQDMSFPNINFQEIQEVNFEDSTWYEWFGELKYLFVIFEDVDKCTVLRKHLLWHAPADMLEALETLYNKIKSMLINNEIKIDIKIGQNGRETWHNNLPGKGFVPYFQIRSKGNKGSLFTTLPDGRKFKKQCLFLNKEYLHSLIKYQKRPD
ncbi:DNA mismatch repair protein MutH [Solibacillus sp. MA9]|uniref:DNA mismatch repair protein MutH n=1 Tax=Solibacillus palustris TaxID=2908203 RepID=A0ABS9U8W3_9BACL|nr:Sau3AI family type II restriction endonuclease [Solibacillus sp. MA9]MCH7320393.1 DNA mismatch repair protein MutH [Solibacillus sp. MA9]